MTTHFAVVTKVPPAGHPGNLASMAEVYLDPQATGGTYDDPHLPIGEALGNPMLGLFIQAPLFELGEVLIMDHHDRDQFGRKPSKWDVTIEEFPSANVDDVLARVRELMNPEDED